MIAYKKVKRFMLDPNYRFRFFAGKGFCDRLPDKEYLEKMFKAVMGYKLNLESPKTFNEKLQWLKLYNRKPEYTRMVDKFSVRNHIAEKLGEEYLIPLLGVWEDPNEIDFDKLPNQFVLKCNHNSGLGMCICRDKSKLDIAKVKKELKNGLKQNYYLTAREWPYKNVKRKIIAEEYVEDRNGELVDYKFFCFNGYADNVMIVKGRQTGGLRFYHFSKDWHICHYNRLGRSLPDDFTLPRPAEMDQMFQIAEKLSEGIPEVRIDLYDVDGRIYFGEYTFFHEGGWESGFDEKSDLHLGNLIVLPKKEMGKNGEK